MFTPAIKAEKSSSKQLQNPAAQVVGAVQIANPKKHPEKMYSP